MAMILGQAVEDLNIVNNYTTLRVHPQGADDRFIVAKGVDKSTEG